MPRRLLSVTAIREHLYWAAGGPSAAGPGEPSLALLGTLFHGVYGALTGADERLNLVRPIERADATLESWRGELIRHAYAWLVGPALAERRHELRGRTEAVLSFWTATRELCSWLSEVLWAQRAAGRSISRVHAGLFRSHEQEVAVEWSDPSWSESVVVEGRLDAVLTQPATSVPCVVELKLGRTAPEADLCQAALYHALLSEAEGRSNARLALVTFSPERVERLFDSAQLAGTQERLRALVGSLAGVVPSETRTAPETSAHQSFAPVQDAPRRAQSGAPATAHRDLGQKVVEAFGEFGLRLQLEGDPFVGPRFVRFFAEPERGVKVRHVDALATSVWMRLKTPQPPQVSLDRGRIAIDVARPDPQAIYWRDLRKYIPRTNESGNSRFPVGVAFDGSLRFADLAEPQDSHFLVAGATGSGKSEWLRATIASLMAANQPTTLRLVLIDPKRTTFKALDSSRYLMRPILYPADEDIVAALKALCDEMERRYDLLSRSDSTDLAALNAGRAEPLPRIVCVCDEYADLILGDRHQRQAIEELIARLGAKARSAGVHLIFATQRASRDVVRGVIDTNLTARVACKVPKDTDSRLILGHPGAATLLGRGDLLFKDLGEPVRLQSPLVENNELKALG
jgi:DNA segregation ATPase FtsK/SpoIIIE, S-DNA-T family